MEPPPKPQIIADLNKTNFISINTCSTHKILTEQSITNK